MTGAMVLTEPDAGSDLQAVRLRAYQDEKGNWLLNGVKRFITNGCGEVLLVLARSEPEIGDGRGLSLFVAERGPTVRVRHLEEKLGIHGSPTCELVFDDTPCRLIGERQRGLITYVMALMNGARVGIAAQSLGVGEAAFRLARNYAHTRRQFGVPIERLPAVAELVTDMKIDVEAARALAYETSRVCDHENNNARVLEWGGPLEKDEEKRRKQLGRSLKRMNGMLTPMCKYYCSEMSVRVAHNAIQVLGGSGYMKDYAAERYLRDSRITTIYEGTSQLQVVAAVRGVTLRGLRDLDRRVGHEGIRRSAVDRAEAKTPGRQAADPAGHPVHQVAAYRVHGSGRPAAGRFGDLGHHRSFVPGTGGCQPPQEAGRPAVHRPRDAGPADEPGADPHRRHGGACRI